MTSSQAMERLAGEGRLADGREGNAFAAIAECHIKMSENVLTPQQIETNTETWGESQAHAQFNGADSYGNVMDIDWNQTPIANHRIGQLAVFDAESQHASFPFSQNGHECAGIDIDPDFFPTTGTVQLHGDDGAWEATKKTVGESYSAHVKSSGRGTRRTEGMSPGCFLCARSSSGTGSYPENSSPPATTTYWPAYLSTSSSKCRWIHSLSADQVADRRCVFRRDAGILPSSLQLYGRRGLLSRLPPLG